MSVLRRIARILSTGGLSLLDASRSVISTGYVCKTCGETVTTDDPHTHEHWCPLEDEPCGVRRCNETGTCQA